MGYQPRVHGLPHPQRELLVVSLTNKRKICHPPQREVLFAHFNFSFSPTPPSTRTSRCIVEKFVTFLKEKFSLPISIFHSLQPHPQRELLVVSLKNLSPPPMYSALCLFQFFTLSYPTLNENFSLYR